MGEIFRIFGRLAFRRPGESSVARILRLEALLIILLVLCSIVALPVGVAFKLFIDTLETNTIRSPEFWRGMILFTVATAFSVIVVANVPRMVLKVEIFLSRLLGTPAGHSDQSVSESVAATERLVASTGDVMVREFQQRIQREIDSAVQKLSITSEALIKTQLAERIDQTIGDDIVATLGAKLAAKTEEVSQLSELRQEAFDRFVQMRNRALQYAQAARNQSTYFRWIGILLALGGLGILGSVLYLNQQQFLADPKLIERHVEWPMFLLRHGPSYAFVALCEFLALIMFRYQSKALEYMRYFSNEATNIDSRHIAYMSALRFLDKPKWVKLIEKIEATERNFLIGKDQRTIELANNENEDRLLERLRKMMSTTRDDAGEEQHTSRRGRRPKSK